MAKKYTTKYKSNLQESKIAEVVGGKTVIASGSLWGSKGDVRTDNFLIECKTTEKGYYSVTSKVWEKICSEATKDGLRIPLLVVRLLDNSKNPIDYAVVNTDLIGDESVEKWFPTKYTYLHTSLGNKSFRVEPIEEEDGVTVRFLSPNNRFIKVTFMHLSKFEDIMQELGLEF